MAAEKKSLNILIADDSKTVCKFVTAALKNLPLKTRFAEAHDGERCLQLLNSTKCDIAFVDFNMPHMTGLDALKLSREQGSKAFVVLMSTDVDDQKRQEARDCGAYDYLRKPIKPKDLTDIINNYIRFKTIADVMVVDDSRTVRSAVKRVLADSVFKMIVSEAESGEETIKECQSSVPDIMFLDVNMPGKDGIQTLKELRSLGADPKTILMTGDKTLEFNKEMLDLGVVNLLYKPFFSEDVDRVIHEIFELRPTSFQDMQKVMTLQDGEIVED